MRISGTIALLMLWPLLPGIPGAAAAQPSSSVLDWISEDPINLTAGETFTVQIINRSDKSLNLRAWMIWSEEARGKKPKALGPNITSNPLAPESVGSIFLTPEKEQEADSYTGVLLVNAYQGNALMASIRRKVRLEVVKKITKQPKLRFLVNDVKLRKYLICDWGDPFKEAFVPLSPGSDLPSFPLHAFLREEQGEIVKAPLDRSGIHKKSGLKVLLFQKGLAFERAGTYSGPLEATDSDTDGTKFVTISVTAAHHPVFALLAITGGLLLALLLQHYTGFLRSYWALRLRAYMIGRKSLAPVEGYSIDKDLHARLRTLVEEIGDLKRSSFSMLDESSTSYQRIKAEFESLEGAVEAWNALPEAFGNLRKALDSVNWKSEPRPPLEGLPELPAIVRAKRELLKGQPLSVPELTVLRQQISEGPAVLTMWKRLNERSRELEVRIQEVLQQPGEKPERIEAAREQLLTIWNGLWIDQTPSLAVISESLDSVEGQVWVEKAFFPRVEVFESRAVTTRTDFDLRDIFRQDVPSTGPRAYERLALLLQARSRSAEILIAILASLIAVYTALKAVYFDKPFGTLRDYADIVVWAAATGTLSDLLLKALDRLWVLGKAVRKITS